MPTWAVVVAVLSALGVVAYVTSWAVAGVWTPGYDATRQAISELFAQDAPTGPRTLVATALVATGVGLVAYAPALHRGLPGVGLAGPLAVAVSGVATVGVALAPCSAGCPGFGTTASDSAHTLTAGVGYLTLIVAPLLFARRVRPELPRFATVSSVIGAVALVGFAVRYGGLVTAAGGLQQRVMNTVADLWYVLAAVVIVARWRRARRSGQPPSGTA